MTDKLKPKKISSKSVYKNQYVEFVVDTLEKDGNKWEQAYFIKPNRTGVAIIAKEKDGVYFAYQYRHASKRYFWQLPMGQTEIDQTEEEAARGELQEEIGFTAEKLTYIGSVFSEPGMSSQEVFVYVAEDLTKVKLDHHHNEIIKSIKKFTLDEVDQMVNKGEFKGGITLSVLYLYRSYIGWR